MVRCRSESGLVAFLVTILRWLLLQTSLAAPLLIPRLPSASIDAASVPKGAPALLTSAEGRILDRWNPHVAADITNCHLHRFPTHGRNYT